MDRVRKRPNPACGDLGAGWAPTPEPRTRSGHSRFLHRLPPLATGIGYVGAAAIHGAGWRRLLTGCGRGPRDQAATGRRQYPTLDSTKPRRSTCVLPGRWRRRSPPEPRLPQPRAFRCAARAWLPRTRGGDRRTRRRRCRLHPGRRCSVPAGEAARAEEEPAPPVWNPGLGRALWRRAP